MKTKEKLENIYNNEDNYKGTSGERYYTKECVMKCMVDAYNLALKDATKKDMCIDGVFNQDNGSYLGLLVPKSSINELKIK